MQSIWLKTTTLVQQGNKDKKTWTRKTSSLTQDIFLISISVKRWI
jgi:hypothetical protein